MANKIWGSNNEPLKIQFITDTHYYSRKGGTEGKAYDKAESKSQKVIKDSDLVIKAGFDMLCEDKSTDIVVIAGDTTRDGEIESHKEFIEMLRDLKKRGKRVYVITATHDFRDGGVDGRQRKVFWPRIRLPTQRRMRPVRKSLQRSISI